MANRRPFTLIVILPTNKLLLDPSLDKDSALAAQLLHRWAKFHAVRSALSLASFLTFLAAAFGVRLMCISLGGGGL